MPPQLRSQNHMDESIPLDLAALSDKLARFALDTESSIQASLQARDVRIDKVESKIDELRGMFKAYIDGKRTEEPNGSNSAGQSQLDNLTRVGPTRPSGSEEILGQSDRVNRFSDSQAQNQRVHTPRFDFPSFDGSNPIEWLESCEFYFECYQTGEMYKTRLASMNFHCKAKEWYSYFRIENPNPLWPILVDAIFERFKSKRGGNAVVIFRRVCQVNTVDEYIDEFERAKARMLAETGIKNDYFYLWSFISGLKEELQHTINLFKPQTLTEAFGVAQEIEMAVGSNNKKPAFIKPNPNPTYKPYKPVDQGVKRWMEGDLKTQPKQQQNLTLEQKRSMGLCYRCNEKWFQGHKCHKGLHAINAEEEEERGNGIEEHEVEGEIVMRTGKVKLKLRRMRLLP